MNLSITNISGIASVAPSLGNGGSGFSLDIPPLPGSARDLAQRGLTPPQPGPQLAPQLGSAAPTSTAQGAFRLALPPLPGSAQDLSDQAASKATVGALGPQQAEDTLVLDIPPLPGSARALAAAQQPVPAVPVIETAGASAAPAPSVASAAGAAIMPPPNRAAFVSQPPPTLSTGSSLTSYVASDAAPRMQTASLPQAHGSAAAGLPGLALEIPPLPGLVPEGGHFSPTSPELAQYAHEQGEEIAHRLNGGDLLDMINPLQHIPIVSTAYRELTGDRIDPVARVVGGGLFGGITGFAGSVANVAIEGETGKDLGEHIWDGVLGDGDEAIRRAEQTVAQVSRTVPMAAYGTPELAFAPLPGGAPLSPNVEMASLASERAAAQTIDVQAFETSVDPAPSPLRTDPGAAASLVANGTVATSIDPPAAPVSSPRPATAAGIAPTDIITMAAAPPPDPVAPTAAAAPIAEDAWFTLDSRNGAAPRSTEFVSLPGRASAGAPDVAPPSPRTLAPPAAPPAAPQASVPQTAAAAVPSAPSPVVVNGEVLPYRPPPLIGTPEDAPAGFTAPNPNEAVSINGGLDAALQRLAGGGPAPAAPQPPTAAAAPAAPTPIQSTQPAIPAAPPVAGVPQTGAPGLNGAPPTNSNFGGLASTDTPTGMVQTPVGMVPEAMRMALEQYTQMQGAAAPSGTTLNAEG